MPPKLTAEMDLQTRSLAEKSGTKLIPLLTNYAEEEWSPESIEELIRAQPAERAPMWEELVTELEKLHATGVAIDWQQIDQAYRDGMTAILTELSDRLHASKLELWLCVTVGGEANVFDLDQLAARVDHFVAQLYGENGEDDTDAGPLASQSWVEEWMDALLEHGEPGQWIAALGCYGCDWEAMGQGQMISFPDVMARARAASLEDVDYHPEALEPRFAYDDENRSHSVWFLDAITFRNQQKAALSRGFGGVGLYCLGFEDPAIWPMLANPQTDRESLYTVSSSDHVAHIGEGELITAREGHADGFRKVRGGDNWTADYLAFPEYPVILHRGGQNPSQVVLTFDDGPDPLWTPRVLDILKQYHAKAAFFVVGSQVARHPGLARRIVEEGHEIGNHTYSHPNLAEASDEYTGLELNACQRAIEEATGRSTLLFRPPYNADGHPESKDEFDGLAVAQRLGYITVSESIDPQDWDHPSADVIEERIRERRSEGQIILLHDAGGDRSETIKVLPRLLEYLRSRGDQVATLSDLSGTPRDALMPPVTSGDDDLPRTVSSTGFELLNFGWNSMWAFVVVSSALVLLRAFTILLFAARHHIRPRVETPVLTEPVSILIAAFNEEKVIEASLRSLLKTDYAGELEIVVIDDGSTDGTAGVLQALAAEEPRIRWASQPNGGKSSALNRGLRIASHEWLISMDADTRFAPDTIGKLVAPMQDPQVAAVAGTIRVGNIFSWLGHIQALEYICGFHLDRRAYDELDCVTVIPGAASALRKSAVLKAGGFSADTLAEDTDLTLQFHQDGYKLRYAADAVAWTEAPSNVQSLLKQRVRWAFGTLQCLWKHRTMIFNPDYGALGFFSLPSVLFFQYFLIACVPWIDGLLVSSLFLGWGGPLWQYVLGFLLMDWLLALIACVIEGEWKRSIWILPMRVLYRPLLAWAVWVSIARAIRGAWVGWGKLERKGIFSCGAQ
jgi:cellulose synthase/poly-beta-1,6-N-acetylglucosamine synthase-like glycosyltransferase/peptidoglycan/xylan/chitin deacetylase (PgdA/CDA1 family)